MKKKDNCMIDMECKESKKEAGEDPEDLMISLACLVWEEADEVAPRSLKKEKVLQKIYKSL